MERKLTSVSAFTLWSSLIWQKSAVGRRQGLALTGKDSDPQHVCNFHMQLLKVDRVAGYPNLSVHQF